MIYLALFWSFLQIGAFSFGGGYAMIPLMEREIIIRHQWLQAAEFADIISISQMTPGPVAINAATFVGYQVGGLTGALFSTSGVIFPSLVLMLLAAHFFFRFYRHPVVQGVFRGLRPVVVALMISAAVFLGQVALTDLRALFIGTVALVVFWYSRLDPLLVLLAAGFLGIILYI